jgi:hypothetical protein
MNNLGFSNDNLFIGDVRIKGQNETLRIGNENGGNGYILPTEKGTEGQVLTMNADNSTSFQDASSGISGRIVKNLFVMREKTSFYNTLPTSAQALFQTGYGSNDVLIGDFPVNSTIHIYSRGVIEFDASSVATGTGVFQLEIDDGAGGVVYFTSNNLTLSKQGTTNPNRFYQVDFIFQRTADNTYKIDGYGLVSDGSDGQKKMGFVETSYSPTTPYTQFTIKASYYKIVSTPGEEYIPLAQVYINDLILDTSLIIDPPPAPTSHTALTDLTAGDAGHTQFAKLNGRSGGQILSGGVLPIHNLTLKSHDIGLPNIIVRDLNTTFEKNLQIGTNQILDTLNNSIDFIGGDMNLLNTSLTNRIVLASQNNIDVLANNQIKLQVPNVSGNNIIITSTDTSLNQALNMNNNNINNVLNINSASNINLNPTSVVDCNGDIDMGSNRIIGVSEVVGDGTNMTIRNGGGISILLDQAISEVVLPNNNLNMNNNVIKNVNNVISSGTLNLESSGGGSQSIQLDGTFITFFNNTITPSITPAGIDINNGVISSVNSINGLTPVGGLSSSTSNSAILTASTAEQSILGLTSVGSRMAPANSFKQGDAFTATLAGNFSSQNGDDLTLRLKGGATGTTILSSIVVPLNGSTNKYFELEINFVVRQIGTATTADLAINYDFSYNQNSGGNFQGERLCEANNTTFDTTIDNQLDITAQFSSTSANNSIETILSTLGKNF